MGEGFRVLAISCGFKTGTDDSTTRNKVPKCLIRVGTFLVMPFYDVEDAQSFLTGYRSGMARIWRTTFVMPRQIDSSHKRGFRFAFLCHWYGRKFCNDQFPEIALIKDRKE